MSAVECLKFRSYSKGHLQGFADLYVPKMGLEIYGCALYMKNGHRWINFPTKEYKNEAGEEKWVEVVRFRDKEHKRAFGEVAVSAIDQWCAENNKSENIPDQAPF